MNSSPAARKHDDDDAPGYSAAGRAAAHPAQTAAADLLAELKGEVTALGRELNAIEGAFAPFLALDAVTPAGLERIGEARAVTNDLGHAVAVLAERVRLPLPAAAQRLRVSAGGLLQVYENAAAARREAERAAQEKAARAAQRQKQAAADEEQRRRYLAGENVPAPAGANR